MTTREHIEHIVGMQIYVFNKPDYNIPTLKEIAERVGALNTYYEASINNIILSDITCDNEIYSKLSKEYFISLCQLCIDVLAIIEMEGKKNWE